MKKEPKIVKSARQQQTVGTLQCLLKKNMKKIILIFSILLLSNVLLGQENKISIGLLGSLDKYEFDFKPIIGFDHEYEINPAYSFGLTVQYNVTERIISKGGFQYSEKGYKLNYAYNFMDPGDPFIPRSTNLKVRYLSIPLFLGYYFKNREIIKLSSSIGIVSDFLINNNEKSVFEDDTERESEFLNRNLNQFLLSSQVNIGIEYHLEKKLIFIIEPYLRYGLNAVDDDIMESNSISYGGIISVNYKLKW
jgi:hypothetical protein